MFNRRLIIDSGGQIGIALNKTVTIYLANNSGFNGTAIVGITDGTFEYSANTSISAYSPADVLITLEKVKEIPCTIGTFIRGLPSEYLPILATAKISGTPSRPTVPSSMSMSITGGEPVDPDPPDIPVDPDAPGLYTLRYNLNGGSGLIITERVYEAGERVTITSEIPTKSGYTFKGWSVTPAGGVSIVAGGKITMPEYDVTLYAVYEANSSGW